jgi:4-amino-4-deoxy-L-arabinose transferase-like glycosyltransferase
VIVLLAIAIALPGSWLLAVTGQHGAGGTAYLLGWAGAHAQAFDAPTAETQLWLLRALPWYTWPLWPLAGWALYAWRHGLKRPHIALPALLLATHCAGLLMTRSPSAADLVFIVAPLVLLAAFGTVSLRRAAENTIDWFAITAFCLFAAALWAYFIAMHAGFPPKMSHSVLRLTAGYVPPLDWAQTTVAVLATAFWLALVAWRVRQPSGALWRGPMLAATGLVMLWVSFSSLFLHAVDHRRSFAPLAQAVATEIARDAGADACVLAHHLRPSHLAVFAYHGRLRLAGRDDPDCPFALHRDLAGSLLDDGPPPGRWTQLWQGHRPGRSDEVIRLYRRAGD